MFKIEEEGYEKGINHFSDWTEDEFKAIMGTLPTFEEDDSNLEVLDGINAPTSIDWRQNGAVNPIVN